MDPFLAWIGLVALIEGAGLASAARAGRTVRRLLVRPGKADRASLIVPFKGSEPGLAERIEAFLQQRAGDTIFVVDSMSDPAVRVIRKAGSKARIIVSKPLPDASGKCAALVAGAHAARGEVVAFADSDALVGPDWLRSLVAPLADPRIGVATGYRWFQSDGSFASLLKCAWDEIGARYMLSRHAFVWGGSFALRRRDLEAWGIQETWKTALSDDVVVHRAAKAAGKTIRFVPQAIAHSDGRTSARELLEFTNRQAFMVRLAGRRRWLGALAVHLYVPAVIVSLAAGLLVGANQALFLLPALALPTARAYLRRRAFDQVIATEKRPAFLALPAHLLMCYNFLRAPTLGNVTWRGRTYARRHASSEPAPRPRP